MQKTLFDLLKEHASILIEADKIMERKEKVESDLEKAKFAYDDALKKRNDLVLSIGKELDELKKKDHELFIQIKNHQDFEGV